jgi:hypothetical protein
MTLENCLTISITDLKKKGFFNNSRTFSVMSWTKDNELCLSADVEVFMSNNEKHIVLTHKNTKNETENYVVRIISIPSNLGNGVVLYFVCPNTGKYSRKLYSCGGRFLHREAIGLLYEQQTKKNLSRMRSI